MLTDSNRRQTSLRKLKPKPARAETLRVRHWILWRRMSTFFIVSSPERDCCVFAVQDANKASEGAILHNVPFFLLSYSSRLCTTQACLAATCPLSVIKSTYRGTYLKELGHSVIKLQLQPRVLAKLPIWMPSP